MDNGIKKTHFLFTALEECYEHNGKIFVPIKFVRKWKELYPEDILMDDEFIKDKIRQFLCDNGWNTEYNLHI